MIETVEYRCKFCNTNRAFEYDKPEVVEARFNVDKMRPLLACNTCADHDTERRRHERAILEAANWLLKWRGEINGKLDRSYTHDRTSELNDHIRTIEVRAAEILTVLTKRFAATVCKFKRVAVIWEQEFVDLIVESPHNAGKHLCYYRECIVKPLKPDLL